MALKLINLPQNGPNDIKYTYQRLPLQDPPKFAPIGIFGLKIYYLANPGLFQR
jgi:hypothetical protein